MQTSKESRRGINNPRGGFDIAEVCSKGRRIWNVIAIRFNAPTYRGT